MTTETLIISKTRQQIIDDSTFTATAILLVAEQMVPNP